MKKNKCIVCKTEIEQDECESNTNSFICGYGSVLDGNIYKVTICDECLEKDGVLESSYL